MLDARLADGSRVNVIIAAARPQRPGDLDPQILPAEHSSTCMVGSGIDVAADGAAAGDRRALPR